MIEMNRQRGFTLIELMIVIAIIGILAAIAIPAYQDYTVRAKMTEVINHVASIKAQIAEAYLADNMVGVGVVAREINTRPLSSKQSRYLSNVTVNANTGVITATTATSHLPSDATGKTLVMTPIYATSGALVIVDWACASTTKMTATSRGFTTTTGTLPAKYAPSECR